VTKNADAYDFVKTCKVEIAAIHDIDSPDAFAIVKFGEGHTDILIPAGKEFP